LKYLVIILLILSAGLTSCTVYKVYPKFTTTSQLVALRGSDSKQIAENKLGCVPYDIYVVQKDGFSIYKWYYKRESRKISRKKLDLPEHGADGEPRLEKKLSEAYLIFNTQNELYSILTKSGRGDLLSLTLFNNDVKVVQQDRLDIWFDPTSKKAVGSNGVRLSYQDILEIIDGFFEGNNDIRLDEVYEMIDHFFDE